MQKNILLRIALVALMLYALLCLVSVREDLRRTEDLAQELRARVEQLDAENRDLRAKLSAGYSPEELRRLAWERLGLVLPGDKIFYFSFTAPEG